MKKRDAIVKLRKLSQRHTYSAIQMHERIGKKMGLAGTDHKYLGFLVQQGRMTAGELAALTGLTTGAVTGLADRFEARGLIRRERDEQDGRKAIIVPDAQKIVALLEGFYKDFQDATDKLFASFTQEELRVLERYFIGALDTMDPTV